MVHDSHKFSVLTAHTDTKDNPLTQNNLDILILFLVISADYHCDMVLSF
jgi:hypothetical protein